MMLMVFRFSKIQNAKKRKSRVSPLLSMLRRNKVGKKTFATSSGVKFQVRYDIYYLRRVL